MNKDKENNDIQNEEDESLTLADIAGTYSYSDMDNGIRSLKITIDTSGNTSFECTLIQSVEEESTGISTIKEGMLVYTRGNDNDKFVEWINVDTGFEILDKNRLKISSEYIPDGKDYKDTVLTRE